MKDHAIQTVDAKGTKIAYELYGDKTAPVILLIHGLGMPMTAWPMSMIESLVQKGFCVLIMDNRDQGQSEKFDHLKVPNMVWQFIKLKIGLSVSCTYSLLDMMNDVKGVLDALRIQQVHVVGASMGGMIAQLLTLEFPDRVKSLTSIMSTTGNPKLKGPTRAVSSHLMAKPKLKTPETLMAYNVKTWQLIGSPDYPTETSEIKAFVQRLMDRGMSTAGTARQMLAILSASDRTHRLAGLTLPCLVIHGTDDPLVRVEGGIETAHAIPNAKLHLIKGMGHDLPLVLQSQVCDLITSLAETTEAELKKAG
jgi:pimeloyl-ACP methyl ester carboxylesterase